MADDGRSRMPFSRHLGLELDESDGGRARGHVDLRPEHSSNPGRMVAHGAVAYALADTVGGAAVYSITGRVPPTVDMRVDYLAPATGDRLVATAEVRRSGESVAVVDIDVRDGTETAIASVRGVYKAGGGDDGSPWTAGEGVPVREDRRGASGATPGPD